MSKLQEQRERFLKNLIKEAILNVLVEQDELQQQNTPQTTEPTANTTPNNDSVTADDNQEEFTVDMMINRLNVLRGGKSLKDPEVYGKLVTFFNQLTDEQKSSFDWILQQLVDIIAASKQQPQQNPQNNQQVPSTPSGSPNVQANTPSPASSAVPMAQPQGASSAPITPV